VNVFLVLLIIVGVFAVFFFVMSLFDKKAGRNKKNSGLQFYAKGKDLGFSFKEIELLRRLAVKSNIEDPTALFWSQNQMDACIRSLIQSARLAGTEQNQDIQGFLSKLYDYRKKLEFEKPRLKSGLNSTRQIGESQNLRILVAGTGVFQSLLIKNASQYITIARPVSKKTLQSFSWSGQRLSVYFWRDDDAGYVFDTDVKDEVYFKGRPALQIAHSDNLLRTQKRKSIRMKTANAAFLYLLDREVSDTAEVVPGFKCILNDISDTGCSLAIGGKASVGLRVKVQFVLDTAPLVLCGTVRSVDYNADANRSVLHIEADPLPTDTRNAILGEIFGMREDDEELPFRITEENPPDDEDGNEFIDQDSFTDVELHDVPDDNGI
jgi:c-di-GMP-binding flagellar brake protein YcgR